MKRSPLIKMRQTCLAMLLASAGAFTSQLPSFVANVPETTSSICTVFSTSTVDETRTNGHSAIRNVLAPCGSMRPVLETRRPLMNQATGMASKNPRVLFLHGEFTNPNVALHCLKLSRWDKIFDFVIPGATNDGSPCPPELFDSLGLGVLEKAGHYCADEEFFTWGCRFDLMQEDPLDLPQDLKENFQSRTTEYIKRIDREYGPFDGVMGFCEGGAALNCILGMKQDGKIDGTLDSTKFFIHMAPWSSPLAGKFQSINKSVPTLSIFGRNEPNDGFPQAFENYPSGFNGYFDEYVHEGQHNYPHVSSELRAKITKLLKIAGVTRNVNEDTKIKNTKAIDSSEVKVVKEHIVSEMPDDYSRKIVEMMCDIIPISDISKESSLVNDLGMDSIHLQEMTLTLEDEFGISIDTDVEERLVDTENTVQDVIDIVEELLL